MLHNTGERQLWKLRIIGFLEGLSYLVLLGIAMPLKYLADSPGAVRIVGLIHGVLFVLYVIYVFEARSEFRWSMKKTMYALVASLIPFGTFYAEYRLFREPERVEV